MACSENAYLTLHAKSGYVARWNCEINFTESHLRIESSQKTTERIEESWRGMRDGLDIC